MRWQTLERASSWIARCIRQAMLLLLTLLMVLGPAPPLVAGEHDMDHTMPGAHEAGRETTTPFARLMESAMTGMDTGMRQAPMSGDPDHDFAAMMIPHHQGAIDMAKAELLYGKNPVLRRLAQEIIVTQNSEITLMQRELQKQAVGGSPSR